MKTPLVSGETKRVARENEHQAIVAIPSVVRIVVVRVEPQVVVIVFHVEQLEITVRICNV